MTANYSFVLDDGELEDVEYNPSNEDEEAAEAAEAAENEEDLGDHEHCVSDADTQAESG